MSLFEHAAALALLSDAEVSTADMRGCRRSLEGFLQRYLPCFYREEQWESAQVVLQRLGCLLAAFCRRRANDSCRSFVCRIRRFARRR